MKDADQINEEMDQVTELVTAVVPKVLELGTAAKPVVDMYMNLLLDSEAFRQLKKEGQQLALSVSFIEAGVTDPVTVANNVKVLMEQLALTSDPTEG